jgi:hypothetical protein
MPDDGCLCLRLYLAPLSLPRLTSLFVFRFDHILLPTVDLVHISAVKETKHNDWAGVHRASSFRVCAKTGAQVHHVVSLCIYLICFLCLVCFLLVFFPSFCWLLVFLFVVLLLSLTDLCHRQINLMFRKIVGTITGIEPTKAELVAAEVSASSSARAACSPVSSLWFAAISATASVQSRPR